MAGIHSLSLDLLNWERESIKIKRITQKLDVMAGAELVQFQLEPSA
jgi:hypothetical protein